MDPVRSHQEQLNQTKTSPASIVLNAEGERIHHVTGAVLNCGRGSPQASSKDKPTDVSFGDEVGMEERLANPCSSNSTGLPDDAVVVQPNTHAKKTNPTIATFPQNTTRNDFFPSVPVVTRSQNRGLLAAMHQAAAEKDSIQCRLRISSPRTQTPIQSENTFNLDTIASVACQVAEAQTRNLAPEIQSNVPLTVPAKILGKRSAEPLYDDIVSKAQKTIDKTRQGPSDAPCTTAAKSSRTVAEKHESDDAEMTLVDGRIDGMFNIRDHDIRTAEDGVKATEFRIDLSPEDRMGLVQEAAADHITMVKDRLITQGLKASLSPQDQASLALKTSTCRSAMQDVLQQFEDFKERVATELGCLRHELEETRTKLRAVEADNCRLFRSISNCECHISKQKIEGPLNQVAVHDAGATACHQPDKPLAKYRGTAAHNQEHPNKGTSPGPSTTGGSQSSGSQLTGPEGSGLLVVRPGSDSETTPFENGGPRRSGRRTRGGASKRRRDNWTAAENSDFLRLVRENNGMEEMDLRRMLAKYFAPRRTHEQCANHLRILRAQKKVPPAIGEAVPYRQRGAAESSRAKETEANGL